MTRILWVSAETPDDLGQGGQRRQYHQIKALVAAGHDISVLTLASNQSDRSLRKIANVRRRPSAIKGIAIPGLLQKIHSEVRRDPAEVIVVSHLESMWMLPASSRPGQRRLVDIHNVMSAWLLAQGYEKQGLEALEREQIALDRFDAATTCSALETRRLNKLHPHHRAAIFTAPLGIDPTEWPDTQYDRSLPLVGLFGSWDWRPNALGLQWFADTVWPLVTHVAPESQAHIAGSGVTIEALPKGMSVVGRVPSIATFAATATVVAVPVLTGVGAPVKFAEALATGSAVIATTDGASAFPDAPAYVSDDPNEWAHWIAHKLAARKKAPAPEPSREYAISNLTWANAVSPIHEWLLASH